VAWAVVYYKKADGDIPGEIFLDSCPVGVEAKIQAVLSAVAEAPPPSFSGGGMWEAMHGDMTGYYEVRVNGPKREHFRLFCLLERDAPGLDEPVIVVLTGLRKAFMTKLGKGDYEKVRALGDEYRATSPRRIAT
jgi:hypothetical protein